MKIFTALVLTVLLSGCVTASYKSDKESFRLSTVGKSAEGVNVEREGFKMSLNKTESQIGEMIQLLRILQMAAPFPVPQ